MECIEFQSLMFDEEFDYDVLLDDDFLHSDCGGNIFQPKEKRGARAKVGVVKSAGGTESVLRMRRKIFRPRGGVIDNNAAVNSVQCRKYLRRRDVVNGAKFKLFAFPAFDRCDSLLFLPTSLAALFNSGDTQAMARVLYARTAKDCKVNINILSAEDVTPRAFVKLQELITETHPDVIMCVQSTRVIANQIIALLFVKFTACKALHNSIARTKKDAVFRPLFAADRAESLKYSIMREDIPDDERVMFHAQMETDLDLVIFKKSEMVLTIDDVTKKLTRMNVKCRLTSIETVPRKEYENNDN